MAPLLEALQQLLAMVDTLAAEGIRLATWISAAASACATR
jgi:hypothetical protein